MCVCVCVCLCVWVPVCDYNVSAFLCALYMMTCYTYTYTHTHSNTHTHTRTHTHTHTHTYTHLSTRATYVGTSQSAEPSMPNSVFPFLINNFLGKYVYFFERIHTQAELSTRTYVNAYANKNDLTITHLRVHVNCMCSLMCLNRMWRRTKQIIVSTLYSVCMGVCLYT